MSNTRVTRRCVRSWALRAQGPRPPGPQVMHTVDGLVYKSRFSQYPGRRFKCATAAITISSGLSRYTTS